MAPTWRWQTNRHRLFPPYEYFMQLSTIDGILWQRPQNMSLIDFSFARYNVIGVFALRLDSEQSTRQVCHNEIRSLENMRRGMHWVHTWYCFDLELYLQWMAIRIYSKVLFRPQNLRHAIRVRRGSPITSSCVTYLTIGNNNQCTTMKQAVDLSDTQILCYSCDKNYLPVAISPKSI